jgi:hypothetical protein
VNIAALMRASIVVIGGAREFVMRIVGILMRRREVVIPMLTLMINELLMTMEVVWKIAFGFALTLDGEWIGVGIRIRKRGSRLSRRSLRPRRSRHRRRRRRRRRTRGTSLHRRRAGGTRDCRRSLGARARGRGITLPNEFGGSTRGSTEGRNRSRRNLRRTSQRSAKLKNIPSVRKVVVAARDAERGTILDDGVRDTPRVKGKGGGEGRGVHKGEQKNKTSVDGHVVDCVDIKEWKETVS